MNQHDPAKAAREFFSKVTVKNKKLEAGVKNTMTNAKLKKIRELVKACNVKFDGAHQDLEKLQEVAQAVMALVVYVHAMFGHDEEYTVLQQVGFTELLVDMVTSGKCNNDMSTRLLSALEKIKGH